MSLSYNTSEFISSFLGYFHFNQDRVLLQTFKDGGGNNGSLTAVVSTDVNNLPVERLAALNDQGAGVFFAVNSFKADRRRTSAWV